MIKGISDFTLEHAEPLLKRMVSKWQDILHLEGRLVENMFEIVIDEAGMSQLKESHDRLSVWQKPNEFVLKSRRHSSMESAGVSRHMNNLHSFRTSSPVKLMSPE